MTAPVYEQVPPTVNGNLVTVDWYANSPLRIYRLLRTLVQQRLIGDKLLMGRKDLTGSGSGIYEVAETIFANDDPQIVAPLTQYPQTNSGRPTLAQIKPLKDGLAEEISDEAVAHNDTTVFNTKMKKMANSLVRQQDRMTLAAITSLVTQQHAAVSGTWDQSNKAGDPFLDIELAAALVDELDQGYAVDTVVLTPTTFAYAVSRAAVLEYMPRESAQNILSTGGNNAKIGGYTYWKTVNMPAGVQGIVLDSTMLGFQAYERLGGGYQGTPGDDASGGLESKRIREDDRDGFKVQARIVKAPAVQEPGSAVVLTGIRS